MTPNLNVGSFPYRPGFNPYQRLATDAIETAGATVTRIAPVKWFPVQHAFANPDCNVLHFDWPHDWYTGKNWVTRQLKRWMYQRGLKTQSPKKLVWTAHNLVAHDTKDLNLEHQMLQQLINRCDGIVVMSAAAEVEMREQYQVPSTTIVQKAPHGHYIDCYSNDVSREDARAKLNIATNEQVFLSIGAVRPYKGHLNLIRSFGAIAAAGQRLIIAGKCSDQEYHQQLRETARQQSDKNPNCKIDLQLEMIPDDDLQFYFNAADICVLPFANVLNSGSLLMAMSFGLPVVASNLGSIPEVAIPEASVLFCGETPDALATAMTQAANQFERGGMDRQPLIDLVREKYAWSHFGDEVVNLYQQLLVSDA